MIKYLAPLSSLLLLAASANSNAAAGFHGQIESVVCHAHNVSPHCQISVKGSVSGATCAGASPWPFVFDGRTPEGQNILSILLTAQIHNKNVVIGGLGTCKLNGAGNSEDLRHVYIKD